MLVVIASGRLGNQLFQYFGVASIRRPGERLVLYGFDALDEAFEGVDARIVRRNAGLERAALGLGGVRGRPGGAAAVTATAAVDVGGPRGDSRRQRRLLARVLAALDRVPGAARVIEVVDEASGFPQRAGSARVGLVVDRYLQRPELVDPHRLDALRFRPSVTVGAAAFLRASGALPQGYLVLHARGTGLRRLAPADGWYRARVRELQKIHPGRPLLVLSDDVELRSSLGRDLGDAVVSDRSAAVDMALMAGATAAALSSSTFNWWGARLASERSPGPFLAPGDWPWADHPGIRGVELRP